MDHTDQESALLKDLEHGLGIGHTDDLSEVWSIEATHQLLEIK